MKTTSKKEILLAPVSLKLVNSIDKKKLYDHGPFLWMGFNCLYARSIPRRQFTFYH